MGAVVIEQVTNLLRANWDDEGHGIPPFFFNVMVFHLYVHENGFITFIKKEFSSSFANILKAKTWKTLTAMLGLTLFV
jgi:hypothetical protein